MKESQQQQISRRRLLKALTAAGGVLAASMLPGKWAKPVVEVGVLPAHAQVTAETVYRINCATDPASGIIYPQNEDCLEIAAELELVSGVGPVSPVSMTLDCSNRDFFPEMLPRVAETDAAGIADFGVLCPYFAEVQEQTFTLLFSCEDPVNGGTLTGSCGPYTLDWLVD